MELLWPRPVTHSKSEYTSFCSMSMLFRGRKICPDNRSPQLINVNHVFWTLISLPKQIPPEQLLWLMQWPLCHCINVNYFITSVRLNTSIDIGCQSCANPWMCCAGTQSDNQTVSFGSVSLPVHSISSFSCHGAKHFLVHAAVQVLSLREQNYKRSRWVRSMAQSSYLCSQMVD